MSEKIPNHTLPNFSEAAAEDALFHYTTSNGLIGMLQSDSIWGTAYYCANDESELAIGKGVLSKTLHLATHKLIDDKDPLVRTFNSRGVDIIEYAKSFESQITEHALTSLIPYIACFCKPTAKEDFHHGLLSQWRGYGSDGGYSLQFSRKKLLAAIEEGAGYHYSSSRGKRSRVGTLIAAGWWFPTSWPYVRGWPSASSGSSSAPVRALAPDIDRSCRWCIRRGSTSTFALRTSRSRGRDGC